MKKIIIHRITIHQMVRVMINFTDQNVFYAVLAGFIVIYVAESLIDWFKKGK